MSQHTGHYVHPKRLTSLSIVLPAYNEEDNIEAVVRNSVEVAETVTSDFEILVVNDGSKDATEEIVERLNAEDKRVKLLNNPRNLGYGPTVKHGLAKAEKDWVFFTDADGQFDMREISRLIRHSDTHDFVIGKRVDRQDTFIRRMNAGIFNIASRVFFGIKVRDVDCAFKLMRRSKLHELELLSESATINTELLHRAGLAGIRIKQVPVTHLPRTAGESTGGDINVIKRAIHEFFVLKWVMLKDEKARMHFNTRVVFFAALIAAILALIWSYNHGYILAYGDAEARLNIAKRVTSGLTPGLAQLGSVWLPLPHILMAPFAAINSLWISGLAGSIVSMASFVFLCVMLYKLAYELTKNFTASYIAPLVAIANPNSIYMATTPMTEILLLATFTGSVYYFVKWLKTESLLYLVGASIFTSLATLTRYDGWALMCIQACILLAFLVLKRKPFRRIEGLAVLYGFIAFAGVAFWFIWNKIIFGSFTFFSESVYGSKEQQLFFLEEGFLPTYRDLPLSIVYFLEDIRLVMGLPIILIALAGLAYFAVKAMRKRNINALFIVTVLLSPVFFYVLSLYLGQASLILPTFAEIGDKFTYSNTRYGLQILPFIALFAAYFGSRHTKTVPLIGLVVVLQFSSFIVSDKVITFVDGTRGLSSQTKSKGPDSPPVEAYMREHYDHGLVLMDDFRRPISPVSSGIPMDRFIGSGNKPYWDESFDDPSKHARWLVVQKANTDAVWENLNRKDLIESEFTAVYNKGNHFVYKRKEKRDNFVQKDGQRLSLNGERFVAVGTNYYDMLSLTNEDIEAGLRQMSEYGFNTVRIWCFNKQGTLTNNELVKFDNALRLAEELDLRFVCTFGNVYNDFGGPDNFAAEGDNRRFFTSQQSITLFQEHIARVMNFQTDGTSRAVKDSPAILAWELLNEPRLEGDVDSSVVSAWTKTMGEYVATQDSEHLISPGTEGFTSTYTGQVMNQEARGSSIEQLCAIEAITLCSGHMYPKYFPNDDPNAGPIDYSAVGTTINTWRRVADSLNKPFIIGEVGYDVSDGSYESREAFFTNIQNSVRANEIDGALLWNYGQQEDRFFTLNPNRRIDSAILENWSF